MQDIQDVYNRIQTKKKERRDLKKLIKEGMDQSPTLQEVLDQMKTLKAKKAELETEIKADYESEISQIEVLDQDIKTDDELMNDIALTHYMKGETITFKDENDEEYEPVFKVSYKKVK